MKTKSEASIGLTARALVPHCLFLILIASCGAKPLELSILQHLQGTWEGFELNRESPDEPYERSDPEIKVRITISGKSLRFHRDADFWWDTTFELPARPGPSQLHTTIQAPEGSKGDEVIAFLKIENGTLTLGGMRDPKSEAEWPRSFETTVDTMGGRYELQKVQVK